MKLPPHMLRPLSEIEEALTLTGLTWPLSVVCVLRLDCGLPVQRLRMGLDMLQKAHPLLNAVISQEKDRFRFERMDEAVQIPLVKENRKDDLHWLASAREEINMGFNPFKGPLMRVRFLTSDATRGKSEIILTLHHSITDAVSLMYLANQLLTCAGECIPGNSTHPADLFPYSGLSPLLKDVLPKSFKGLGLWFHLLPFLSRLISDERKYNKAGRDAKEAPVPASSDNELYVVGFSEEETAALIKWARKKRISLNNMITSAMILVMNRMVYGGNKTLMRTIQFANLRPYLQPPVSADQEGSFISLMRVTVPVSPGSNIVHLASYLDQLLLKSAKRGDKFLFALFSKLAMKKTIREHNTRMGNTALSFGGPVQLKRHYGNIQLNDVHGFITNIRQGPEISGFGKIFSGRLSLDMNFLSAETGREKANLILEEIKTLILKSISEI